MAKQEKLLFEGEYNYARTRRENTRRVTILQQAMTSEADQLSRKLLDCEPDDPCNSGACHACNWSERRVLVPQVVKLFKRYNQIFMITLVPLDMFKSKEDLKHVNVRNLKNRINKQLSRTLMNKAIIFGYVEIAYKPNSDKLCVHLHIFVVGVSKDEINDLRRYYSGNTHGIRQMRVDPVEVRLSDLLKAFRKSMRLKEYPKERRLRRHQLYRENFPKTLSYALKNTTGYRDKATGRHKSVPSDVEVEHLIWLDQTSFRQRVYIQGLRLKGNRLFVTD